MRLFIILLCFFPHMVFATGTGSVLISKAYIDPIGTDTGQEWIQLSNTSTGSILLENWLLDLNNLPDYSFPSITLGSGATLSIHLRSSETNSGSTIHLDDTFSNQNISNSQGFLALYNSSTKSAETIMDYIAYGAPNQSHLSKAEVAGLWREDWVAPSEEGKVLTRILTSQPLFHPNAWKLQEFEEEVPKETPEETPVTETGSTVPTPSPSPNNPPVPVITLQGPKITQGPAPLRFNVTGEESSDPDNDDLTFTWNFGNGLTSDRENPLEIRYESPGQYTVQLTVTDIHGTSSSTHRDVIVEAPPAPTPSNSSTSPSSNSRTASSPAPQCTPEQHTAIQINELLPNPDGTDTNREWIELHNTSTQPISLCQWSIDDDPEGSDPYVFPQLTIPALGYYLLESLVSGLNLNNTSDSVRLFTPNGTLWEEISYQNAPSGKSYARFRP